MTDSTAPLPADSPDWEDGPTAMQFLAIVLDQQRQMEFARREWHERFLADQKRIEEWRIP
jgi:hypothetical protein